MHEIDYPAPSTIDIQRQKSQLSLKPSLLRAPTYYCFLPKVDPLVMAKLSIGHVSMVPDDLANMFGWHVFLLSIHKAKLSLL